MKNLLMLESSRCVRVHNSAVLVSFAGILVLLVCHGAPELLSVSVNAQLLVQQGEGRNDMVGECLIYGDTSLSPAASQPFSVV